MSSADTLHALQSTYLDAGTQTEGSPLPECSPDLSQQLGSAGCTCICSCQDSRAPPRPPVTPPAALAGAKKERKPTPVSDRSLLGSHPPSRFGRVTNRVVSLPELDEETALDEKPFVQPRVASMPGAFPPFFPTGMDEESSLDAIPLHALSGTVFTMQHEPRSSGFPQTPSPPVHRRDPGVVAFSDDRPLYGEHPTQDWITWASSPPKPIPALHGPLSLPYARCPSGAEGTLIESDNRVSNVIWGLDNAQPRTQPQPDDSPLTEESPALSEFSTDAGPDPLLHAAFRLAHQIDGLCLAPPGTPLLSPIGNSMYLAGLGLDFKAKRHLEAESIAPRMRPTQLNSHAQARDSRRVVSAGSLAVGAGGRLKAPLSTNCQVPTPPLPQWTPRFPDMLSLPDSRGYSDLAQRDSPQPPTLDHYPRANVARPTPMEYSIGSETNPGSRFDFYDYPPHEHAPAAHSIRLGPSRRDVAGRQEKQDAAVRSSDGMVLASHVTTQRDSAARTIHRRLPVLEEDASFAAFPKHTMRSSQGSNVTQRRQGSAAVSRASELHEMNSGSATGTRSAVRSRTHCATPMPTTRTIKPAIYTAPHRRTKERKEA